MVLIMFFNRILQSLRGSCPFLKYNHQTNNSRVLSVQTLQTFYLRICDGVPVFYGIVYTSEQDTREVYGFFSLRATKPVPRVFPSYFFFPLLSGGSLVQTQMLMCLAMVLNIRTCAKYGPLSNKILALSMIFSL